MLIINQKAPQKKQQILHCRSSQQSPTLSWKSWGRSSWSRHRLIWPSPTMTPTVARHSSLSCPLGLTLLWHYSSSRKTRASEATSSAQSRWVKDRLVSVKVKVEFIAYIIAHYHNFCPSASFSGTNRSQDDQRSQTRRHVGHATELSFSRLLDDTTGKNLRGVYPRDDAP